MSQSAPSTGAASSARSIADADPVTRNALRYTVSAREYQLLHQYLLSRAPLLRKRSPPPQSYDVAATKDDDYNAATIRLTARVFLTSYAGLNLWDIITERLSGKKLAQDVTTRPSRWRSPNFRLALSLSAILFFHRLFHRFFTRLRESLRGDDARPFRRRNPRITAALTSKIAPAIGASLAGLFLGLSPADQTRITIAIYVFSRSLEFTYNSLDERGYFKAKPWWFGSWLMMPMATGQLLHAFVFDRDCFPASYGNFILRRSPEYIQQRPADYPKHLPWPSTFEIVDSLANISRMRWPAFVSPILFPKSKTLPASLTAIAPVADPAHPAIKNLSCALLHPHDPSCLRTHVKYYVRALPLMARFWTVIYGGFALLRWRNFATAPLTSVNKLAGRILRTSFYLTSAIGTAWGSICLMQNILPRNVLPTGRWFLGGFIAGLWAYLERGTGRDGFLYSARMSIDSFYKVGRKKGWWKGVKNGDVLLFMASLMVINVVYERNPKAVSTAFIRKTLSQFRGDGWVDRAVLLELKKHKGEKEEEDGEKKEQ